MTQINPKPIVLKDVTLLIGADNYEKQVAGVSLVPDASTSTWQGLSPSASYSDTATATWTAELDYAQDWETPGSLSDYLLAQEGNTVTAVFKPRVGGGASFQVQLVITPGAIGGKVNAWQEASVKLAVVGKPIRIPAGNGVPVGTLAQPASGPIAGGTFVQISGSGFTGTTAVAFGTTAATGFTVVSDTLIVATAPAQAAGSKPVKVTNGTGAATVLAPYTYV